MNSSGFHRVLSHFLVLLFGMFIAALFILIVIYNVFPQWFF